MERKSRRSSILKPQKARNPLSDLDFTDVTEELPVVSMERHASTNRRVSFANSNFIKAFATDPEMNTIWDTTYEEMINSDSAHSVENEQQSCTLGAQPSDKIQIIKKNVLSDIDEKENLYLNKGKTTHTKTLVVEKKNKRRLTMATEVLDNEDRLNQSFFQMSKFEDDDGDDINYVHQTSSNSENFKNKMNPENIADLDDDNGDRPIVVKKNISRTESSFDKSFFISDTNDYSIELTQAACNLRKSAHNIAEHKTKMFDNDVLEITNYLTIDNKTNVDDSINLTSVSSDSMELTQLVSNSQTENYNLETQTSTSNDLIECTQLVSCLSKENDHNSADETITNKDIVEFTQVINNSPIDNCNDLSNKTITCDDIVEFTQPISHLPKERDYNLNNKMFTNNDNIEFTQVISNSQIDNSTDLSNKTSTTDDIVEFTQLVDNLSVENCHILGNKTSANNDLIDFTQLVGNLKNDISERNDSIKSTQTAFNLKNSTKRVDGISTTCQKNILDQTNIEDINFNVSFMDIDENNCLDETSTKPIVNRQRDFFLNSHSRKRSPNEMFQRGNFIDFLQSAPDPENIEEELNGSAVINCRKQKGIFDVYSDNVISAKSAVNIELKSNIVNRSRQNIDGVIDRTFKNSFHEDTSKSCNENKQSSSNLNKPQCDLEIVDDKYVTNRLPNKMQSFDQTDFKEKSFIEHMGISNVLATDNVTNSENIELFSKIESSFNAMFDFNSPQNKFQNQMNSTKSNTEASRANSFDSTSRKAELQNEDEINNSKYNEVMIDANFDNHSLCESGLLQAKMGINDLTCTLKMPNISVIKLPKEDPDLLIDKNALLVDPISITLQHNISTSFQSTSMEMEFPKGITPFEIDNSFFVNKPLTKSIQLTTSKKDCAVGISTYCKDQADVSCLKLSLTNNQNANSMDLKCSPHKNSASDTHVSIVSTSKGAERQNILKEEQNQNDTFNIVKADKPLTKEMYGSPPDEKKEAFENYKSATSNWLNDGEYISDHEINAKKPFNNANSFIKSDVLPEIIISDYDKNKGNFILGTSECGLIRTSNIENVDEINNTSTVNNSYKESTNLIRKSEIEENIQARNNLKLNLEGNLNNCHNNRTDFEIKLSKADRNEIEIIQNCESETTKSSFHMNFSPNNSLIDDTKYLINYNLSIKQPKSDFSKIIMGENCSLLSSKFMALSNFSNEAFPISLDNTHTNQASKQNKNEDKQTTVEVISKLKRRSTENIENVVATKKTLSNSNVEDKNNTHNEKFKESNKRDSILNISQEDIILLDTTNIHLENFKASNEDESILNISQEVIILSDSAINNSESSNTHLEDFKESNESESILNISPQDIILSDIANNSESNLNKEPDNPFRLKTLQLMKAFNDRQKLTEQTFAISRNNINSKIVEIRETVLKIKDKFNEQLQDLLTPYKEISFDDIKTDIDYSNECSADDMSEEQKYFETDFNLDIDVEKIPTLKEKIEEKQKSNKGYWKIVSLEEDKCELYTLFNSIRITLEYVRDNGMIIKTNISNCISDAAEPFALFANKILMERLSRQAIQSAVGDKYDILTLLDYVHINMQKMIDMLNEFRTFEKRFCMEMDSSFKVTFQFINIHLRSQWQICVDLLDIKNLEKSVTVTALIGTVNERQIKHIASLCPCGISFLKNFIDRILDYICELRKNHDMKIETEKTKQM